MKATPAAIGGMFSRHIEIFVFEQLRSLAIGRNRAQQIMAGTTAFRNRSGKLRRALASTVAASGKATQSDAAQKGKRLVVKYRIKGAFYVHMVRAKTKFEREAIRDSEVTMPRELKAGGQRAANKTRGA